MGSSRAFITFVSLLVALAAARPAAADPTDASAIADDGHPLAGWHNGLFYLRDPHDDYRLYPSGSAQIDAYTYFGPGVGATALKPTLLLRRIRPEVGGELFHRISFVISGDFGQTTVDKKITAAPANVWINVRAHALFNLEIGQLNAPFTLENRTSERYTPFMERSLTVRDVAVPTNKDIGLMLWGESPDHVFYYSTGVFNGAGQNRLSTDGRADVMGRAFFHPLATAVRGELKDAQIGMSARYGSRDKAFTAYDYPAFTTQGNYTFWSPIYAGASGHTHVIPSGDQVGFAGELRVPVSRFDLTGEFVWIDNGTREGLEGFEATNSERFGRIRGWSYYLELGAWPFGKRDINGLPGYDTPPHLDFGKSDPSDPPLALQVLAKWEQVSLHYESASRSGKPDSKSIDGEIVADAFSLGANLWITKHVRFSANYVLSLFPTSEPPRPTPLRSLHELLFRAGLAL